MEKSDNRILTTHVGSLPRVPALRELLKEREKSSQEISSELRDLIENAVSMAVDKQLESGIDIGNNGEQPRVGFSTYVTARMEGFGGESPRPESLDLKEYPDYRELLKNKRRTSSRINVTATARAAIKYNDLSEAADECDQFLRLTAEKAKSFTEQFMTAASPGIIATTMMNKHYDSHENYLSALAQEMRKEYELIHSRGLLLQLDCPDLAMERSRFFQDLTLKEFQNRVELHIDAINQAIQNIPKERIRLHVCWGNTDSPHVHDVPLKDILPLLYKADVGALSLELANPRHQHEYKLFKSHPLPPSMLLLPGIIDSTINYVEHPQVVADRICQVVDSVGDRSRVIASTDCGFGTFSGSEAVAATVVWSKLDALTEGAAIASKQLW